MKHISPSRWFLLFVYTWLAFPTFLPTYAIEATYGFVWRVEENQSEKQIFLLPLTLPFKTMQTILHAVPQKPSGEYRHWYIASENGELGAKIANQASPIDRLDQLPAFQHHPADEGNVHSLGDADYSVIRLLYTCLAEPRCTGNPLPAGAANLYWLTLPDEHGITLVVHLARVFVLDPDADTNTQLKPKIDPHLISSWKIAPSDDGKTASATHLYTTAKSDPDILHALRRFERIQRSFTSIAAVSLQPQRPPIMLSALIALGSAGIIVYAGTVQLHGREKRPLERTQPKPLPSTNDRRLC